MAKVCDSQSRANIDHRKLLPNLTWQLLPTYSASMQSLNKHLMSWPKFSRARIAGSVLAVFMLQVIAAGFCMPMANAAVVSKHSDALVTASHHPMNTMNHCQGMKAENMSKAAEQKPAAKHVCAHCDFPDINISLDKLSFDFDQATTLLFVINVLPPAQTLSLPDFKNLSPPTRTSLFTFDLIQRFRV